MSAKAQINAVLARLTGHHLVKGAPGAHLDDVHRRPETGRQPRKSEQQRASGRTAQQSRHDRFARDYDATAIEIIKAVRPYSMTNNEKLFGLIQATRYVARNHIDGDIVECGVWRGGSMQAVARTLLEVGDPGRELYLFDTFAGMSEPTELDVRRDGRSAADLLQAHKKSSWVWAIASLDDVQAGFAQVPYPEDKLHYVVGKVEDTIPRELPARISILRLDTDWYESTKHELEHAYPRLSPGGILIIDDYGHWAGSRQATDEYVATLDEPLLLHRLGQGRIAVKPFPRPV